MRKCSTSRTSRTTVAGNVTFYALAVIPVVLTLTVLAVDISGWSMLRDRTQREADRLSFLAAQLLPDSDAALSFVSEHLAQSSGGYVLENYSVNRSSVSITLGSTYNAAFDFFLESIGKPQIFSVSRSSIVQLTPTDYVLVISDGRTLRPSPADLPWGDDLGWPASNYWSCPRYSALHWSELSIVDPSWSENAKERWATQSCFNPILTEVKLAAIDLVDGLSAFETNRVGLIFTPGDRSGRGYFVARHVRSDGASSVGGFPGDTTGANAFLADYREFETGLGNEACVLFSDPDIDSIYPLSGTKNYLGISDNAANTCLDPLASFSFCATSQVRHYPYNTVDSCYLTQTLRLREAIYWNAAKLPNSALNFNGNTDVPAALEAAFAELVGVSPDAVTAEVEQRGNIAFKTPRTIVLLTDTLPNPNDARITAILDGLGRANVNLVIAAFHHGYSFSAADNALLSQRVSEFKSAALDFLGDESGKRVHIFEAESPEVLKNMLVPKLMVLNRELVLRS